MHSAAGSTCVSFALSCLLLLQVSALMEKWSTAYWRSPNYNLVRALMTLLIALFYGMTLSGSLSPPIACLQL